MSQSQIAAFVAKTHDLVSPILHEPGTVLYSTAGTLVPGDYYFLGLNPGGDGGPTIASSIKHLPHRTKSEYVEKWGGDKRSYSAGQHPLQRNAALLFQTLGTDLSSVCASNLIFTKSKSEHTAAFEHVERCWKVHQLILEIVQPRAIITFGRQPYWFLRQKLDWGFVEDESIPAGHGSWRCHVARTSNGRVLLGLPHLSVYSLAGREHVLHWLRENLLPRTT